MIIKALGNVYIFGSVYQATITATGSIDIKGNVVGSKLYSGYYGVLFNRLYKNSKKLSELLQGTRHAAKQLTEIISSQGKVVKYGQVFNLLVESKFKEIPQIVKEVFMSISNIQSITRDRLDELKLTLEVLLQPMKLFEIDTADYSYNLQYMLAEVVHWIERSEERSVQIDINQCHLSELKSNGDILIRREGVVQSQLYAKKNIAFYDFASVCRGSKLRAGEKVMVSKIFYGRICVDRFCKDILEPVEDTAWYIQNNRFIEK